MGKRTRKPCGLLQLPLEIRSNIFDLVVSNIDIIRPNVEQLFYKARLHETSGFPVKSSATVLALALTCRQIHDEALRSYFGCNTFLFYDTYNLYRYLYMIGRERRKCIRNIVIYWAGDRRREAAELVGECTNLQSLYIGVGYNTTQHSKHPQRDLWRSRGMGQLKKLCGFPNLDLRVRELNCWGADAVWATFNIPISEANTQMFESGLFGRRQHFDAGHVVEFEKGLKEQMGKASNTSAEEEDAAEDVVETSEMADSSSKELGSRILRKRKANNKWASRRKKMRKLPARKAGKKGEILRRVRRF